MRRPPRCVHIRDEYMVALYALWYNFMRVHKTLRTTPAMAAGIDRYRDAALVDGGRGCAYR